MANTGFIKGIFALISLLGVLSSSSAVAAPEAVRWYPESMPIGGGANIEYIVDIAVSPDYDRDNTLFMLAWGGGFNLWRGNSGNGSWEMLFSGITGDIYDLKYIQLSPQYGSGSRVLYIAGSTNNGAAIWKSDDGGQGFTRRSVPLPVDAWAVIDDSTLFIAGYDGSHGIVYKTQNGGASFSPAVICGNQPLNCIALSPQYDRDGIILTGNSNGWIYLSDDGGSSFRPLPFTATSPPLEDEINVAFDSRFESNGIVYAASESPGGGVYRFVMGVSQYWEEIDTILPPGAMLGGLDISVGGVLYASNFQQTDTDGNRGGMQRCLEPAQGKVFETVTGGLDDGATLVGLWTYGNRIWSIDTTNIKLMLFVDSLSYPVRLEQPANQATGIGKIAVQTVEDVRLDWQPLSGAESYLWQLDDNQDFLSIEDGFEGNTTASSVNLPPLETGKTYYWRVRAREPLLSFWSEIWSFTTGIEVGLATPELEIPLNGATGVPISPLFRWSAVDGADAYEILVSSDSYFNNAIIDKSGADMLTGRIWQSDVNLLYDTTYHWRARAVNSNTSGSWSNVATFTTEAETEPEEEVVQQEEQIVETEAPLLALTTLIPPSIVSPAPPPDKLPVGQKNVPAAADDSSVAAAQPPQTLIQQFSDDTTTDTTWVYGIAWCLGGVTLALLITTLVLLIKRH